EVKYATRKGTRLLNMTDFRDDAHSNSWDHSTFVKTYGFYLDQGLDLIANERKQSGGSSGDSERSRDDRPGGSSQEKKDATPLKDMIPERIFWKMGHLQRPFGLSIVMPTYWSCKEQQASTNDGFQMIGKKKKGKSKSTNDGQFDGPSMKQNLRYEPKASTNTPKKGATNVGNAFEMPSMLKTTGHSSKKDNIFTSNSYSALNDESDEDVKNVYDESANLCTKSSGSSSFTAAAGYLVCLRKMDDAHSNSWDHSTFIKTYGFYLDQRLDLIAYEWEQSGGSIGVSKRLRDDRWRLPQNRRYGYEYNESRDEPRFGNMRRTISCKDVRGGPEGSSQEKKDATPLGM
nr:putative clathrin assembly protein At2g25430 [Tanacetum cinerariifolium]